MEQLLKTQFFFPRTRSDTVARPRLSQRLAEGIQADHKMTGISAPAGFGKTTLVCEVKSW